ncbi:MAG: AsmA-like C-terminal region-containing protein [Thermoanaerobaculia bacterium]
MSKHSLLRRLIVAGAICVGLVVALVALLLVFQPTLNLSPFKRLVEAQLADLVGIPVTLQELHVKTSLQPGVDVRGLQVADAASVEETRLQIELIPLLRRRISIGSLQLDQVTVQVRPMLGLVKEWLGEDDRPKSLFRFDALENLEFDRAHLNLTDSRGDSHRLAIDELDGGVTRSSPLKLKARGSFDDVALQLEATGPTLEELFTPDSTLPLAADLGIAGARVSAEGTLTKQPSELALALDFTLEGDDLTATLAAAEIDIPSLGPFRLRGSLAHSGGPIHLSALEGQVDEAHLSGNLELNFESENFALAGTLETSRIDLRPWLKPRTARDDPDIEETGSAERLLEWPLPVAHVERALAAMDLHLEVAIDGLEGLPTTVEDLTGSPHLQDGRLTLPYGLQLAGAPVQGQVQVASTQGQLELDLELSSSTLSLDQLTDDLGRGLTTGTVGQVHIAASSSGNTVGDLLEQLAVRLETGDAQIRFRSPDSDRQVDLVLTQMELRRSADVPLLVALDGDLRGHPYHIELIGQDTKDWRSDDPWPFKLVSRGLGSTTRIEGHLSPRPGDLSLALELDISGDRIGDLEPWWGVPADADYPYKVHGHLSVGADQSELDLDSIRIGQTAATMKLLAPRQEKAPIFVDLAASTVALDELMRLVGSAENDLASEPVLTVDIPIWPDEVTFPDSKIHLELDRVLRYSPDLDDLSDVVADIEIHQSHLENVIFSGDAGEARFRGGLDLDWVANPSAMTLEISAETIDLGRLVPLEAVAPGLAVRADRFELQVTAAAQTLRQMFLEGADISGKAEDVLLAIPFLDEKEPLELTLHQAEISESPNNPLQVTADGLIGESPIDLELRLRNKSRTDPDRNQIPVELSLQTGDVRLETRGDLKLPALAKNIDLGFTLTADRISSFEPFLGHRISEVGPVAATGDLTIRPDSYSLGDLSLEVGQSDVNGKASLDLTGARPRIAADLSSRRIHLAELLAHAWAPEEDQGETAEGSARSDDDSDEEEVESWLEKLESSKLASMDLDLNLQADDIYWGGEHGGGGQIRAMMEEGRLSVGPFNLALSDGSVGGQVSLLSQDGFVDADVGLEVDSVEYGPILSYFDPMAKGTGELDLQTELRTSSVPVEQVVAGASGGFRFAVFPRDIDTTLLDLWGAGLFRSMFSVVDPTDESVLNCMAGDFSIADGKMTVNNFWFDTSRIRARGKGSIDLETMTVDMTLRPRPKKRTFLTLATPAKITGPIEDPSISLARGGFVGTAFRIYMWALTLYAQILKRPLPTDGSDVCFLPPPPETAQQPLTESTAPPKN